MWKLAGHLTQTAHLLLVFAFAFAITSPNATYHKFCLVVVIGVVVSGILLGDCVINIVSNWFFKKAGHPGYRSWIKWALNRKRPVLYAER